MWLWRLGAAAGLVLAAAAPLDAQQWNTPATLDLVRRAVARRQAAQGDSSLSSYRTRAHGFVFFLAQMGQQGLTEAPRLVKGDELDVEVYWQAPNRSKQVILGWRDGTFLPTDVRYHRDHLGIVTNNFGNLIRIGEGDEVRDVVHPLSPGGLDAYDFAIQDSLAIRSGTQQIVVRAVAVRPRSFARPLVVGTLYLDAASADLVRFRFSFTPAAYLDRDLEDIDITLENALFDQKYWLPYRQEVEIRRRVSWLDLPARGIIRGRWEINDYDLNVAIPDSVFRGPAIAGLRRPDNGDTTHWRGTLQAVIDSVAAPLSQREMEALRLEVERIAGAHLLSGLSQNRPALGSLSELMHVNRVQGLAFGAGATLGISRSRLQLHPTFGIGTADGRATGGLELRIGAGGTQLLAGVGRRVRDLSDFSVISPVLNSLAAQEFGQDHGDWLRLDAVSLGVSHRLSPRTTIVAEGAIEHPYSLAVAASPANGTYRPNPGLGAGEYHLARLRLEQAGAGLAARRSLRGSLLLEAGDGPTSYVRAAAELRSAVAVGSTELAASLRGGVGSAGLPDYRSFVLGGRGTLLGEPYRAYGGRRMAVAQLEWRIRAPAPALALGSYASTGRTMILAPFLAAGWADRAPARLPWTSSGGVRPVAGLAAEFFMRLIRVEAGVGLRDGGFGLTVDINRDWWGIL